jgi:GMP synthase (glutamine-hydrolysing)
MGDARVYVFQHVACEDLGSFAEILAARGLCPKYVRLFAGEQLPGDCSAAAALVFLGGPMSVNEETRLPYLASEKALIRRALDDGTPLLGVCLGAQLLAAAAGSRVFPGARPEIGWAPVSLTMEGGNDPVLAGVADLESVFHWHGETFDLPPGAVRLAFSALTMNQAFRVGRCAYGFQFHMEVTPTMIETWLSEYAQDLGADAAGLTRRVVAETQVFAKPLRTTGGGVFNCFLDLAGVRRS